MTEISAILDVVIKQMPNMLFAAVAIYYLVKQNQRAIDAITHTSDRQFELLEKMCMRCTDKKEAST